MTGSNGCNCKRSVCLKKYCECFFTGNLCGKTCKKMFHFFLELAAKNIAKANSSKLQVDRSSASNIYNHVNHPPYTKISHPNSTKTIMNAKGKKGKWETFFMNLI